MHDLNVENGWLMRAGHQVLVQAPPCRADGGTDCAHHSSACHGQPGCSVQDLTGQTKECRAGNTLQPKWSKPHAFSAPISWRLNNTVSAQPQMHSNALQVRQEYAEKIGKKEPTGFTKEVSRI